jgi:hypothetical protein
MGQVCKPHGIQNIATALHQKGTHKLLFAAILRLCATGENLTRQTAVIRSIIRESEESEDQDHEIPAADFLPAVDHYAIQSPEKP